MTVHWKIFAVAASFNSECLWLYHENYESFPLECFAIYGM